MTSPVGHPSGMDQFALDADTAERLVRRAVDAGDAPPEYRDVALILHALRDVPESSEWAGEPAAVARIAAAVVVGRRPPPTRRVRRARRSPARVARLATAAVAAAVLCLTGVFASAGALPEPAQNAASTVLGTVGISVPKGDQGPGVEEPSPTTTPPAEAPATNPSRPTVGAAGEKGGAAPASSEPGHGEGDVHGARAHGSPSNTANGQGNDHSWNGSPSQGEGNDERR